MDGCAILRRAMTLRVYAQRDRRSADLGRARLTRYFLYRMFHWVLVMYLLITRG